MTAAPRFPARLKLLSELRERGSAGSGAMLARYLVYVDGARRPTVLRYADSPALHGNTFMRHLLEQPGSRSEVERLLADAEATRLAVEGTVHGNSFVAIPLLDADGRCVAAMATAETLERVPIVLHEVQSGLHRLSDVVHVLPNAVLTARPSGRFDYANQRWYQKTGMDPFAPLHESVTRAVDPHDASDFSRRWWEGIKSGGPFTFRFRLTTLEGVRWHELRANAWVSNRRTIKWVASVIDVQEIVDAQEASSRSEARLRFSSEAGRLLEDVAEPGDIVQRIAALTSESLQATCYIGFVDPDSRKTHSGFAGPGRLQELHSLASRNGAPSFIEHRDAIPGGVNSIVSMPLRLRGTGESPKDQGLAILARIAPQSTLNHAEFSLFSDVVLRISAALGQRIVGRRNLRTAERLQRAMLPASLPRPVGLGIDAAYEAAGHESLVGGDWYDAFVLHDGTVALGIGDVAGHGIDAAIIMNRLRYGMRLAAFEHKDPAHVLRMANEAANLELESFATAFFALLDPQTLAVRYANAGHPPGLTVARDGTIQHLPATCPPLGVQDALGCDTGTATIPAGGALLLHTDAIVESERDLIAGEALLAERVADWARRGFEEDAQALHQRLLSRRPPPDDAALLIVRDLR